MHVNAKTVAFGGLMLALTQVCIALGSVIETNTLFLLAAASYCVGIVIREAGMKIGAAFYFAGVLLGILIAPNKFYVFSYAAMGLYILLVEFIWERLGKVSENVNRMRWFRILKMVVFNTIYIIGMVAAWNIMIAREATWQLVLGIFVAGQFGWFIYDWAYEYVQRQIWTKMRGRLL